MAFNTRPAQVLADINYVRNAPAPGGPELEFHTDDPSRDTMQVSPGRRVTITDARSANEAFSIERTGFQLCRMESKVERFENLQLNPELLDRYCREVEQFLMDLTGGARVVVRRNSVTTRYGAPKDVNLPNVSPALFAHADNTDASALENPLKSVLDELEANGVDFDLNEFSRYAYYNVWRCFSPAPQDIPLAVCDARTVDPTDELAVKSITNTSRFGVITHGVTVYKYNPNHRWYYFRDMAPDEVLVFKQHDSKLPLRRTPHTAFIDPSCPPGGPTRNSVEARGAVFFK
jgi:hypothetical protein